ncbi:MAG: porphobilinogen synthase [Vulcanibacillus sp.]
MNVSFLRHRRLRQNGGIRNLVRENSLNINDLIYPIFVIAGKDIKNEIGSMPNVFQLSLDQLDKEIEEIVSLGIQAVILFGIPETKDPLGKGAYDDHGIVQEAIKQIKRIAPELIVVADTCLCEFTDHGHCGVVQGDKVLNDPSLELLTQTAISQAKAGADIIAPSNMMDGFVAVIRKGLDDAGYTDIPIMSYAVKYSSAFYGPFREAAESTPKFGDRKTYQMDPANSREALREAYSDITEGADLLIVKPALAYMDIIRLLRDNYNLPIVAYNVSGEYSMVKAAAKQGWINEKAIVLEMLTGMKRSGADIIITYFAKDIARWLQERN